MRWKKRQGRLIVQVDGGIGATAQAAGLGVVVRDERGRILQVWHKQDRRQTNVEAEYRALIWGLEIVRQNLPAEVHVFSDSEVMVNQMTGRFLVHSPELKILHREACVLATAFDRVLFTYIPRELNCLADALATEALWTQGPWARAFQEE